jgi:nitrite reductase/ring-hydroxylating ferredoxin subunit
LEAEDTTMMVTVGKAGDVAPGHIRRFTLDGVGVSVANVGGRLYAFDDTCTHQGCSLADGDLDGVVVTCACHGSEFDVTTGAVLRGPAERPVRSRVVSIDGDDLVAEE